MIGSLLALYCCTGHYNLGSNLFPISPSSTEITLKDGRITESSGLAVSTIDPSILFTHNDSGDSARIFAFNRTGRTLATLNLSGVKAIDFEDMATCKLAGKSYIYVGDIGDNSVRRKDIKVYRFEEPRALNGEMPVSVEVFTFTYPDGPHDAETLLVHPKTGEIEIVAKTDLGPSGIYSTGPNPLPGTATLSKRGAVEIQFLVKQGKLITGGAWAHSADRVVLRTYLSAYEFSAAKGDWWKSKPRIMGVPFQPQAEAITYSSDDRNVFTSSEGSPCIIYQTAVSR